MLVLQVSPGPVEKRKDDSPGAQDLLPVSASLQWEVLAWCFPQVRAVQVRAGVQGEESAALNTPGWQRGYLTWTFIIYSTSVPSPVPSLAMVLIPLLLLPAWWDPWGPCRGRGGNLRERVITFPPSLTARGKSIT